MTREKLVGVELFRIQAVAAYGRKQSVAWITLCVRDEIQTMKGKWGAGRRFHIPTTWHQWRAYIYLLQSLLKAISQQRSLFAMNLDQLRQNVSTAMIEGIKLYGIGWSDAEKTFWLTFKGGVFAVIPLSEIQQHKSPRIMKFQHGEFVHGLSSRLWSKVLNKAGIWARNNNLFDRSEAINEKHQMGLFDG